jgi:signal transduction histidine kinase
LGEGGNARYWGETHDPKRLEVHIEAQWIAMLGHELRNPLGAIGMGVELMKSESLGAARRLEIIEMIQRQLSQIGRLADDLLDVTGTGEQRLRIERKSVDLRQVGLDAIDTVGGLLEERRQELSLTLPPAGAVCVRGDHARLIQVVVNLLENATKYTPPGGRIVLEIAAARARLATITIRDTGIGIPSDLMPRIFDLFAQGRYQCGSAKRGVGLGLTLVRNFVELHGGRVEASSAGEHQGSEFKIELPRIEHVRYAVA